MNRGQEILHIPGKPRDALGNDQVDLSALGISKHLIEGIPVLEAGSADSLVYVNAVFDTNGKASSGAQSAGKGLISWAFAVLPVYPTGLRKPYFSFQ